MSDRDFADELAAELAREVIASEAPAELPLLGTMSRAFFENPERVVKQGSKDEMLGFGVESVAVLTPYVLAIARPVAQFIVKEVLKDVTAESSEAVLKLVRRLFGRREEPPTPDDEAAGPQSLSQEQLARVHELALGRARELDIDEAKAAHLADAMVASLVLESA